MRYNSRGKNHRDSYYKLEWCDLRALFSCKNVSNIFIKHFFQIIKTLETGVVQQGMENILSTAKIQPTRTFRSVTGMNILMIT